MKKRFMIFSLFFVLFLEIFLFPQEDIINAARQNRFDTFKRMLEENTYQINNKDRRNCTILHYAASGSTAEMVEWLIQHGAETDVRDVDGDTLLHWAAYAGREKIVNLLISHGLDIDTKNNSGVSVIDYAAVTRGNQTTVDLHVLKGAKIPNPGHDVEILLHRAALIGSLELVRSLISKGISTKTKMPNGATFLHNCAEGGLLEIVAGSVKTGPDCAHVRPS
ncbi:ankyrin repeat domain-containing protein [Acidobacteriota bacterium]